MKVFGKRYSTVCFPDSYMKDERNSKSQLWRFYPKHGPRHFMGCQKFEVEINSISTLTDWSCSVPMGNTDSFMRTYVARSYV